MNDQEKLTVLWELYTAQHGPYVPPPPPRPERLPEGVQKNNGIYQAAWHDNGTDYIRGAFTTPDEAAEYAAEQRLTAVPLNAWGR